MEIVVEDRSGKWSAESEKKGGREMAGFLHQIDEDRNKSVGFASILCGPRVRVRFTEKLICKPVPR